MQPEYATKFLETTKDGLVDTRKKHVSNSLNCLFELSSLMNGTAENYNTTSLLYQLQQEAPTITTDLSIICIL